MTSPSCTTKEFGQYPTPVWVAEAIVERYFFDLGVGDCVVEPSCGPGAFLAAIPPQVKAIGVEIDALIAEEARRNTGRPVLQGDFQSIRLEIQPTVILGNPPFNMRLVDGFLNRAHELLPEGGKCGFILPSFAFQTASRVSGYAERWSLMQEMIPRNIFRGLSLPLVFAIFSKDRKRKMIGFALYRETVDMQNFALPYRNVLEARSGPIWLLAVEKALRCLGGEADIQSLYAEIENERPTMTHFWKEQIRRTLRRYEKRFLALGKGRYRLQPDLAHVA